MQDGVYDDFRDFPWIKMWSPKTLFGIIPFPLFLWDRHKIWRQPQTPRRSIHLDSGAQKAQGFDEVIFHLKPKSKILNFKIWPLLTMVKHHFFKLWWFKTMLKFVESIVFFSDSIILHISLIVSGFY